MALKNLKSEDIFPDLETFLDWADVTLPTGAWKNRGFGIARYEEPSSWNSGDFEPATYDDVINLGRSGFPAGLERMTEVTLDGSAVSEISGFAFETGPVGCMPIVPNAIQGLPDSMFNITDSERPMPVVRIAAHLCVHEGIPGEAYISHGATVASLIDSIEASGVSVELTVYFGETGRDGNRNKHVIGIPVKLAGQPLDRDAIAFSFIHPGFFRRLIFTWIEQEERDDCLKGHGAPWSVSDIAAYHDAQGHHDADHNTMVIYPLSDPDMSYEERLKQLKAQYEAFCKASA